MMLHYSRPELWVIILGLGVGTYLIRFSFIGLIGNRELPPWILRHLRYAPMAVIPAMIGPLVMWPQATGGVTDPVRVIAALATLCVGMWLRNALAAILSGAVVLAVGLGLGLAS